MPRGRQPEGDSALSNAERQARHRAGRRQLNRQPRVNAPRWIGAAERNAGTMPLRR